MRRGFSLKELLIVIALLALLAAILTPVIVSAKEKGRAASCLSNVSQLSKAVLIYLSSNDDAFPLDRWQLATNAATAKPRADDQPRLICPNYRRADRPTSGGTESGGYAINACISSTTPDAPAQIVMIAETARWDRKLRVDGSIRDTTIDWLMEPDEFEAAHIETEWHNQLIGPIGEWGSRRHSGRGNYAFADGHARSLAPTAFYIPTGHPCGYYTNPKVIPDARPRFASLPFGKSLHPLR